MRKLLLFIIVVGFSFSIIAQSKEQLEKERKRLNSEIEKTNKNLETTSKSKQSTLKSLNEIKSKVEKGKRVINDISYEITLSDKTIDKNNLKIDSLSNNLNDLHKQYYAVQRYAYLRKISNNKWTYILSSANINTFLLRWRYLNQFESYTKTKYSELTNLKNKIANSNEFIVKVKEEKTKQLETELDKTSTYEAEKTKNDKLLKDIASKEENLLGELRHQKVEREKLNRAIDRMINAELAAARARANTRKNSTSEKDKILNDAEIKLGDDFASNKNKLPWPISSGNIVSKFGNQAHPSLKGVSIENNGIDIKSRGSRDVKSVFDGEVVGVTKIQGSNYMVIIRHGNYYSVYSNLDAVYVTKDSKVKVQQALGNISANEDGISQVHFELWKDKSKLNPESWLR